MGNDRILNVRGVAAHLKIGLTKAYELVHSDGFPSFKVGRCIRVDVNQLSAWVEEQSARGERY